MTLPLSDEPVVAKNYQDLNTGCIYELDETTGTYTEVYCPPEGSTVLNGSGPPADTLGADGDFYIDTDTGDMYGPKDSAATPKWPLVPNPGGAADTSPPPVPVIKGTPTSSITQQADGTPVTAISVVVGYGSPPAGLTDLAEYLLQSTRFTLASDATQPDWTLATQWAARSLDTTGTADVSIVQPGVVAATSYWLRVAAGDRANNRSAWSAATKISTVGDAIGPGQPTGVVTAAGMNVFSVRWDPSNDEDYAYTEVQWRVSPSGNWSSVQVGGTMTVVVGLTNGTLYNVRVRSVDRSGNTLDADGFTYDVADPANSEKGWVSGADVTPAAIPGSSLVWDSATIAQVFAGKINADWILAGTLLVGQGIGTDADAIKVVDSRGNTVGRWTSLNGIEMFDPPRSADSYAGRPSYKMTLDTRGLIVWDMTDPSTPIALATVGPIGIDAASITFGSARGGHNLAQNSSFELGGFAATATTTSTWDVAADWNAAGSRQGADVNLTTGPNSLVMATV